jgi:hypothetical protein
MKIASHQPNFVPWIGYFYKMAISDVFVIADDVDFTRKSFINRNRIKTPSGPVWLTVPLKKMPLGAPINLMEIASLEEIEKLVRIVRANYTRAPFYKWFFEKFESTILSNGLLLCEINIALIRLIIKELRIDVPVLRTSEMNGITGASTDRIISICRSLDASTYISGFGGQKYQSEDLMKADGISCQVYNFKHPEYRQLWGPFLPNMSVIDMLFNCGPSSGEIIKGI